MNCPKSPRCSESSETFIKMLSLAFSLVSWFSLRKQLVLSRMAVPPASSIRRDRLHPARLHMLLQGCERVGPRKGFQLCIRLYFFESDDAGTSVPASIVLVVGLYILHA